MAVDLDAVFGSAVASAHQQGMARTAMADANLSQSLGVINNLTIQAQGDLSSNPALIAALQTASRAPVQGSNELPK